MSGKPRRSVRFNWKVIEDLPAGYISAKKLEKGKAIRIMTGAPVPKGADAVISAQ